MSKLNKTTVFLEKVFWVFLFINPFLDILNGFYINTVMGIDILDVKFVATLGVTPSLVVRMIMLVVFAAYILLVRDKYSILTAIPIGAAWLLSMLSEYLNFGFVQFFLDTQYTARFCFNIVLLMVYTRVFANRWDGDGRELLRRIDVVIAVTTIVLSLSILISAIVGVGYSTYADRLGYRGSRGFFYAGNDITAILTLLLPLCAARTIRADFSAGNRLTTGLALAACALGANTLLIIGSKTAFIAFAVTFALMLVFTLIFAVRDRDRRLLLGYALVLSGFLLVFAVLMLLSHMELWYSIVNSFNVTGELAAAEGVETAMLSGRQDKLLEHLREFREGGVFVWLFGLSRGSQSAILEMDVFEVLFYYGVFGLAAMLWLYVKLGIQFFCSLFRKLDIVSGALFTSLALCTGYLIIAGHVLFSVTSGFYFAFVIVYSRVYFADSSEKVLLWKGKDSAKA